MRAEKPIKEIMTVKLVTVSPETTARDIKRLFERNSFHHLPVLDKREKLVGMVSREDFYKLAHVLSLNSEKTNDSQPSYDSIEAAQMMTKYPLALDPDDTIGLAADIILANTFHALPILDDEKLVGIITSHDLLKYSFDDSKLFSYG